jgi:hypothetical protein
MAEYRYGYQRVARQPRNVLYIVVNWLVCSVNARSRGIQDEYPTTTDPFAVFPGGPGVRWAEVEIYRYSAAVCAGKRFIEAGV